VVIFNEINNKFSVIDYLLKENKTNERRANRLFKYGQANIEGLQVNLFECTNVNQRPIFFKIWYLFYFIFYIKDLFLTERNLVIITFSANDQIDRILDSVKNRFLVVLTKVRFEINFFNSINII
jgi:hypothetical protein